MLHLSVVPLLAVHLEAWQVFALAVGLFSLVGVLKYFDIRDINRIKKDGTLMKAWIVQANDDLYKPGRTNRPAILIAAFPDQAGVSDEYLHALARRMFDLRTQPPQSKAEQIVSNIVLDEGFQPQMQALLPTEFTGGPSVYWYHEQIDRSILPGSVLSAPYIQIRAVKKKNIIVPVMVKYERS